jgi:iron complex outermembrane receptor protein
VTPIAFFEPRQRTIHVFNLFAQDEISLGRGLYGTLGSKLEHNTYSGWEVQPTARVRWTRGRDTLWGAVSRAVRMPTRFDTDIRFSGGLPIVLIAGNPNFRSESVVAYEAGFRSQPAQRVSYAIAVYHNEYDDLRSQDRQAAGPVLLGNTVQGHINGIELGATWEPSAAARIHGSYAWLHRSIAPQPGSTDVSGGEGNDAPHLAALQLFTDIRPDVRVNAMIRYVAALPRPRLRGYAEADLTLQWDARPWAELALTGHNLLHRSHAEFFSGQSRLEEYDRSLFVTLTLRRR